MKNREPLKPVERLFAFVRRAGILIVGRETLARSKSRLHFVLIAKNLSENSRREILAQYAHYPIVQRYASAKGNTDDIFVFRNGQKLACSTVYQPTDDDLSFQDASVDDLQNGPKKSADLG